MKITITLQGTIIETAVTQLADNDGLKSAVGNWFSQDEPRWFERGDVFHSCGVVLDKTTKVTVTGNGKRIDAFRLAETSDLFRVDRCAGNSCGSGIAGILAMEISQGKMMFEKEDSEYNRSKLFFKVVRVGGYDAFSKSAAESTAQYYLVDGADGFVLSEVAKGDFHETLMVARGLPFRHPADLKYDSSLAGRFRKTFLR